jgi:ADP-heptose:LPS heptosyltransferase
MNTNSNQPRRVAIFRALQLGDMLCAVPALRALRAAWPDAQVTLIGLEDAASFVARFHAYLDDLMIFPGVEGMPEQPARPELMPAFFAEARARGFDLAIQMHGSGQQVNDIVDQLGAQHTAGFKPQFDSDAPSDDFMPWPGALPEPTRYTALMEFLGIPVDDLALAFPLSAQDQVDCDALVANMQLAPHRTVVIHPGARLESRRWPVERFAAVAGMLVDAGWQVAVTGSEAEQDLTASLIALAGVPVADLTGRTSLGSLAALLARCRLLVCNDTGVSHVAAAVHAPSVVVASGSDVARWAPLDRHLHRVLWHNVPCRPCAHPRCPTGHECAAAILPTLVLDAAMRKLMNPEPSRA